MGRWDGGFLSQKPSRRKRDDCSKKRRRGLLSSGTSEKRSPLHVPPAVLNSPGLRSITSLIDIVSSPSLARMEEHLFSTPASTDAIVKELARGVRDVHITSKDVERHGSQEDFEETLKWPRDRIRTQSPKARTVAGEARQRRDRQTSALPPPTTVSQQSSLLRVMTAQFEFVRDSGPRHRRIKLKEPIAMITKSTAAPRMSRSASTGTCNGR